jgi:RsiW-degrading membrane proteinase PrsW (M82 family)
MALWVTCDNCRRQIKARGATNNTIKCPTCSHLQYVPDATDRRPASGASFSAWGKAGGSGQTAVATPSAGSQTDNLQNFLGNYPSDTANGATAETGGQEQTDTVGAVASETGGQGLLYWLLLLTLIPLGFSLFQPKSDVRERFERTLHDNPGIVKMWKQSNDPSLTSLLNALPQSRIQGAFLPRDTWLHWGFAGLASVVFLVLCVAIFPKKATNPFDLSLIGLFTGTIGVILLFVIQFLAYNPWGLLLTKAGSATPIFWILQFIGFSYRSALDPNSNFVLSFLGFTAGVGLCEEVCKALPMIWYYRSCETMSWRGACRWGLASGIGFGISEGIAYSADFYNGIHTSGIYLVRFVSCVGLHAIWSASVGLTLYKCQSMIQRADRWHEFIWPILRIVGVAMILHGLYDTLLKKEIFEFALAVAVVSFGWLAWQIESLRDEERKLAAPLATPASA